MLNFRGVSGKLASLDYNMLHTRRIQTPRLDEVFQSHPLNRNIGEIPFLGKTWILRDIYSEYVTSFAVPLPSNQNHEAIHLLNGGSVQS